MFDGPGGTARQLDYQMRECGGVRGLAGLSRIAGDVPVARGASGKWSDSTAGLICAPISYVAGEISGDTDSPVR